MFLPGYSEIYLTWLTGIRLLVEGSVIEPYIFGEQGLRYSILHTCRDLAKAEKRGGAPIPLFCCSAPLQYCSILLFNPLFAGFRTKLVFNALELFVKA